MRKIKKVNLEDSKQFNSVDSVDKALFDRGVKKEINYIIDLSTFHEWINPPYKKFLNNSSRYLVFCSGSGTGKSHFFIQKLVYRALTERGSYNYIIRKVFRSIRKSAFPLLLKIIDQLGLTLQTQINYTEMSVRFLAPFNSTIICLGCDNTEKIKSLMEPHTIFIEEASEITESDFNQINLRLRGKTDSYRQIMMGLNPVGGKKHWIYKTFFINKKENSTVVKPTIFHNNFIDKEYIKVLQNISDPDLKKIYYDGEWVDLTGLIFNNYQIVDTPDPRCYNNNFNRGTNYINKVFANLYNRAIGVDWGFNHPSCLVFVGESKDAYYIQELLYETHLTNNELIEKIKHFDKNVFDLSEKGLEFICDSAEPARIEELCKAGFNAKPANKIQGSITSGISILKSKPIMVTKDSVNVIKELETYSWKKDKDGKSLEVPEDFMNHAMDAIRYVVLNKHTGKQSYSPNKPVVFTGYDFLPPT